MAVGLKPEPGEVPKRKGVESLRDNLEASVYKMGPYMKGKKRLRIPSHENPFDYFYSMDISEMKYIADQIEAIGWGWA